MSNSTSFQLSAARLRLPVPITEQVWPEGTVPVVSVFSWVYNHVEFIRQSIESILVQETTFPVEIIIHDDASPDGTTGIIREYEAKYPQLFRNIIQTENQWSQGKSVMTPMFEAPRGEFIALTHGDDNWTDTSKLERQVQHFNLHPECAMIFHNAQLIDYTDSEHSSPKLVVPKVEKAVFTTKDLMTIPWFIPTASKMFRAEALKQIAPNRRYHAADLYLQLNASLHGELHYLERVMSVYRRHDGGVSQKSIPGNKEYLEWTANYFELITDFLQINNLNLYDDLEYRATRLIEKELIQLIHHKSSEKHLDASVAVKDVETLLDQWEERFPKHFIKYIRSDSVSRAIHKLLCNLGNIQYSQGELRSARNFYLKSFQYHKANLRSYYYLFRTFLPLLARTK